MNIKVYFRKDTNHESKHIHNWYHDLVFQCMFSVYTNPGKYTEFGLKYDTKHSFFYEINIMLVMVQWQKGWGILTAYIKIGYKY